MTGLSVLISVVVFCLVMTAITGLYMNSHLITIECLLTDIHELLKKGGDNMK